MIAQNPDLVDVWRRSVASCDASRLVAETFSDLGAETGPVHVLALGKAAGPMAGGALDVLGHRAGRIVVISGTAEGAPSEAGVYLGEHPHPGPGSFAAGRALMAAAREISRSQEKTLVLVGGGGSALCEVPAEGLGEDDLRVAHQALVSSGAPIETMNRIRRRLSAIKGGGLARALGPSLRWVGILVDVPSCDPGAVASGPCDLPPEGGAAFEQRVLAGPETLAEAAASHASLGGANRVTKRREIVSTASVEALGDEIIEHLATGSGYWVASGEVSVPLPPEGPRGRGGRAQHLALWVLREARRRLPSGRKWAFLAAGSDGRDGAGAAGAVVSSEIDVRDQDLDRRISEHSSGEAHRSMGTLLEEHDPRTNVTDLYLGWAE